MPNIAKIQTELNTKTADVLSAYKIPNIAAVIVNEDGKTVLHSVKGIKDTSKSATAATNQMGANDYFNVGSISKPITGFFMACLIKRGVIKWETKIKDVFPEVNNAAFRERCGINENFLNVTVAQLFDHTCGMNGYYYFTTDNNDTRIRDTDPFRYIGDQGIGWGGNSRDPEWKNFEVLMYLRYQYAMLCLKQDKYVYNSTTNLKYKNKASSGYGSTCTIATAMAEKLTGKNWEKLMYEIMLNEAPMQMTFGNLPNNVELHQYNADTQKYEPNPWLNNEFAPYGAKFMTGGIHVTVGAMAQYLKYNIPALNYSAVFDVNAYQKVSADAGQGGLYRGGSGDNISFSHNGSTGSSYADLIVYPKKGYGIGVMTNSGGGPTGNAAPDAVNALMAKCKTIIQDWDSFK